MLKRTIFILLLICSLGSAYADHAEIPKRILLSVNPAALLSGSIAGTVEVRLSEFLSVFFYTSYYNLEVTAYHGVDPNLDIWKMTEGIGLNYYFDGSSPEGFFLGTALVGGYVYVKDSGMESVGALLGLSLRLGRRWIWRNFSLAPNASIRYTAALMDKSAMSPLARVLVDGFGYRVGLGMALAF